MFWRSAQYVCHVMELETAPEVVKPEKQPPVKEENNRWVPSLKLTNNISVPCFN
jgi:hypothetical protein